VAEFPSGDALARRLVVREEYAEICVNLFTAADRQRVAQPGCLFAIGFAPAIQRASDLRPTPSRQKGAVENVVLDFLDAVALTDAKNSSQLPRCGFDAAGIVGPGHEMVARETGFAHHFLEGDVRRVGHRGSQRPADRAV